jgi:chemotaxis protein histidine kinase CheA
MSSALRKQQASAGTWDQWVDGLHGALAQAKAILAGQGPLAGPERDALMRAFHLLKGYAQGLGLQGVQSVAHELESRIGSDSQGAPARQQELRESLRGGLAKLDGVLQSLLELRLQQAARGELAARRGTASFAMLFGRIEQAARGIAAQLGLRLELACEGGELPLPNDWEAPLEAALLHAVRNSVDHGAQAGSAAPLEIRLSAARAEREVVIEIRDNGAGIAASRVREAARERQARFDAEMGALADEDVLQLLFLPGLSLSRGVSRLSGRGYGLNIVREAVEGGLGGKARLESRPGQGTVLRLRIPAKA